MRTAHIRERRRSHYYLDLLEFCPWPSDIWWQQGHQSLQASSWESPTSAWRRTGISVLTSLWSCTSRFPEKGLSHLHSSRLPAALWASVQVAAVLLNTPGLMPRLLPNCFSRNMYQGNSQQQQYIRVACLHTCALATVNIFHLLQSNRQNKEN